MNIFFSFAVQSIASHAIKLILISKNVWGKYRIFETYFSIRMNTLEIRSNKITLFNNYVLLVPTRYTWKKDIIN